MLAPEERARIAETYRVTVAEDVTVTYCPRGASGLVDTVTPRQDMESKWRIKKRRDRIARAKRA